MFSPLCFMYIVILKTQNSTLSCVSSEKPGPALELRCFQAGLNLYVLLEYSIAVDIFHISGLFFS